VIEDINSKDSFEELFEMIQTQEYDFSSAITKVQKEYNWQEQERVLLSCYDKILE
jgi:hypothetical protein